MEAMPSQCRQTVIQFRVLPQKILKRTPKYFIGEREHVLNTSPREFFWSNTQTPGRFFKLNKSVVR